MYQIKFRETPKELCRDVNMASKEDQSKDAGPTTPPPIAIIVIGAHVYLVNYLNIIITPLRALVSDNLS